MIITASQPIDVVAELLRDIDKRIKETTAVRNKAHVATDRAEANGAIHALSALHRDIKGATIFASSALPKVGNIVTARSPRKIRPEGATQ